MGTWFCRSLNSSPNNDGQAFSRSLGRTTRGPWSRLSVEVSAQASSSVHSSVADAFARPRSQARTSCRSATPLCRSSRTRQRIDGVRQPQLMAAGQPERFCDATRIHGRQANATILPRAGSVQAADQKKCFSDQNASKPESHGRTCPAALSGPAGAAATRATRGRGRRALSPTRLQRCPDRAALRRCSRIRGLPDADDTHPHATDHARHAPTPSA